jgi:hypothetical protein
MKRYKDVEKGRAKGKGFGNCWKLNKKRDPKIFTYLEAQFKNLADDFNLKLNHEVRIKVRDKNGQNHIFKLDFLHTETGINVEISPNWHKNYLIVARRDALRRKLLKKVGIRMLTVPAVQKGKRCCIDVPRAKRVIKLVLSAKTSPNNLDFYLSVKP